MLYSSFLAENRFLALSIVAFLQCDPFHCNPVVTIPYFDPAPTSLVAPMPSVELEAKLIHSFPLPRTAMTWGSNIISLVFDRPVLLARNRPEITVSR